MKRDWFGITLLFASILITAAMVIFMIISLWMGVQ